MPGELREPGLQVVEQRLDRAQVEHRRPAPSARRACARAAGSIADSVLPPAVGRLHEHVVAAQDRARSPAPGAAGARASRACSPRGAARPGAAARTAGRGRSHSPRLHRRPVRRGVGRRSRVAHRALTARARRRRRSSRPRLALGGRQLASRA
jgi:hypothetical protein